MAAADATTPTITPRPESPRSLQLRRVPIGAIHLDPANARSHPERNMDAIKASLLRFRQAEPLVVHKSSGRVIGGNARLQAMRELGWEECDIVEVDLEPIEATALGIALNRSAELAVWTTRSSPSSSRACAPRMAWRGWDTAIRRSTRSWNRRSAKLHRRAWKTPVPVTFRSALR